MSHHETAACLLIRDGAAPRAPGRPKTLAGTAGRVVYDSRRDAPGQSDREARGRREATPIARAELARWSGFAG
jgi:hypothetical protein